MFVLMTVNTRFNILYTYILSELYLSTLDMKTYDIVNNVDICDILYIRYSTFHWPLTDNTVIKNTKNYCFYVSVEVFMRVTFLDIPLTLKYTLTHLFYDPVQKFSRFQI